MTKARKVGPFGDPSPDNLPQVVFFCQACNRAHCVPYITQRPHPNNKPVWFFDENFESPTIEPSLREFEIDGKTTHCHVVVTNGFLNYCGDHPKKEFAGKSVPMQDYKLIGQE